MSDPEVLPKRVYRLLSDAQFHSGTALAASCGYMVATILSGLFAFLLLHRNPEVVSADAAALLDAGSSSEII